MDSGLCPLLKYILQGLHLIDTRLCICHQHDLRVAALLRSLRSRQNILLICKSRIPKMHMRIRKPRCNQHSLCIQNLGSAFYLHIGTSVFLLSAAATLIRRVLTPSYNPCNHAILNIQICRIYRIFYRIYDLTILNYQHVIPLYRFSFYVLSISSRSAMTIHKLPVCTDCLTNIRVFRQLISCRASAL